MSVEKPKDPYCGCACRRSKHHHGRGLCESEHSHYSVFSCDCKRFRHENAKEKQRRLDNN